MTQLAGAVEPIVIEVLGEPRPKGSKSAVMIGGRARVIESKSANGRRMQSDWKAAITAATVEWHNAHGGVLLDVPVAVTLAFRLPRPKSAPKRRVLPDRLPDVDKIARLALDVLTNLVWVDDARVCDLHVTKRYAVDPAGNPVAPGCTITIEVLQ